MSRSFDKKKLERHMAETKDTLPETNSPAAVDQAFEFAPSASDTDRKSVV